MRDPMGFIQRAKQDYGDVVRLHFGPMIGHLISSPEGVNHVLAENNKNYGKQTRGYESLRYVLGLGTVYAFIIGFQATEQVDDILKRTADAIAFLKGGAGGRAARDNT